MIPSRFHFLRTALAAVVVTVGALPALPAGAQSLIHRYSFNGNANDSVGSANGVAVGSVTFATAPGVNGSAAFAGGTTASNPGYVSLPTSAVSGLQNATVEIFTTNFNMPKDAAGQPGGAFQSIFSAASAAPNAANYVVLCANRAGSGLGTGAGTNGANQIVVAHDPLPISIANHVIDLVYSGFTGVGSTGAETIYVDGVSVAQGPTVFSFADVAAGAGGIGTVGIGGGSPFNDPTFSGSMNEVRIFGDALSPVQVLADVAAGPGGLGFTPVLPSTSLAVASASGSASQTVTLSSTLKTAGGVALSGQTLTFSVDGAAVGTGVTDMSGVATRMYVVPATLTAGSHTVTTTFNGDGTNAPSSGTATLTVTTTATTLVVSPASGSPGQSVTLKAVLKRMVGVMPVAGESVSLSVDGSVVGTAVTSSLGLASLVYVIPTGDAIGSSHPVAAAFAGAGSYTASSGTSTLTVSKYSTSVVVLTVSGTPGQTVTLSANLKRTVGGTALSGAAITFTVDGAVVGTGVTNAAGAATLAYALPAGATIGSHPVMATFAGDASYTTATGKGTLSVKNATSLAIANVSGAHSTSVTLSAALTVGGAASPGKTVAFKVDGKSVGTAVTNASGMASLSYAIPATATVGSHPASAAFAGDAADNAATGAGTLSVS